MKISTIHIFLIGLFALCTQALSAQHVVKVGNGNKQDYRKTATAPEINFEYVKQIVSEDTAMVEVKIRVDNYPDTPVRVSLVQQYSTGTDSVDYIFNDQNLVLNSPSTTIVVQIMDDDSVEMEEILVLRLVNPQNGVNLGDDLDTIVIKDNDGTTSTKKAPPLPDLRFNIYPNPATNFLIVDSEEEVDQVVVRDILGNEVMKRSGFKNKILFNLDISHLKQGVYLVEAKSNGRNVVKKVVVE